MRVSTSSILAFLLSASGLFAQPKPQTALEPIQSALRSKNFDQAIELSGSALRSAPNNAQLWTLQGIAFAGKGDSLKRPQLRVIRSKAQGRAGKFDRLVKILAEIG